MHPHINPCAISVHAHENKKQMLNKTIDNEPDIARF
jgi:hypothetical protein